MLNWIGWTSLRVLVTFVCAWTMTNLIAVEGYRMEHNEMFIGAVLLVILIILWSPRCNHGNQS